MPIQPLKRISVPGRRVLETSEETQKKFSGEVDVLTKLPPELTVSKIPYNLRASYVCYLRATMAEEQLTQLCTYLMDQGDIKPDEALLIKIAKDKVAEFTDRLARKLKM